VPSTEGEGTVAIATDSDSMIANGHALRCRACGSLLCAICYFAEFSTSDEGRIEGRCPSCDGGLTIHVK